MIVAGQKVEDGVERVPPDLPDFLFGNLRKRQCGRPLKVDVVGEGEGGECGKR